MHESKVQCSLQYEYCVGLGRNCVCVVLVLCCVLGSCSLVLRCVALVGSVRNFVWSLLRSL